MNPFFSTWLHSEEAHRDVICTKRLYIDINDGNLIDGMMFGAIMYWHGFDRNGRSRLRIERDGHLWLAKAHGDWYDEIRVTERQARESIKRMRDRGLIITHTWKFNDAPTTHIRVDADRFAELCQSHLTNLSNRSDEICQNDVTDSVRTITETTTENTKEGASSTPPPPPDNQPAKKQATSKTDTLPTKRQDLIAHELVKAWQDAYRERGAFHATPPAVKTMRNTLTRLIACNATYQEVYHLTFSKLKEASRTRYAFQWLADDIEQHRDAEAMNRQRREERDNRPAVIDHHILEERDPVPPPVIPDLYGVLEAHHERH